MTVSTWIDLDQGDDDLDVDAHLNDGNGNPFICVNVGNVTLVGRDAAKFRTLAQAILRMADKFEAQVPFNVGAQTGEGQGES